MNAELRSDAINEALAVEVLRLLKECHVAGVSIALISDPTLNLTVGYGLRNAVTGTRFTPQTVFEAYSLTKPLVAYRALSLYRNGLLDLDRPLEDYLNTPYIEYDYRAGLITARTVLAHTSGLLYH